MNPSPGCGGGVVVSCGTSVVVRYGQVLRGRDESDAGLRV